jgi:hypothetical protein
MYNITLESSFREKVQYMFGRTVVNDTTRFQKNQIVKHVKDGTLRLVDGGDHRALTGMSKVTQEFTQGRRCHRVQTLSIKLIQG